MGLVLAFAIFLAVALAGGYMAMRVILKRPIPSWLSSGHWMAAAAGLAVLGLEIVLHGASPAGLVALAACATGFAGGFVLFGCLFAAKRPPIWAVAAHGSLGWIGVVALWFALSGRA